MTLILGTVQFGLDYGVSNTSGQPSEDTVFDTLDTAFARGITTLDSAQGYGEANALVAAYHKDRGQRFQVINKILRHPVSQGGVTDIVSGLRQELDLMQLPSFECLMFHYAPSVDGSVPDDFFDTLKAEGIAKASGLSIERPDDYYALSDRFDFDVVQLPLNVMNQNFMPQSFLEDLKARGVTVHARSAFLQGVVLTQAKDVPAYLHKLYDGLAAFQHDMQAQDLSYLEGALAFLRHNSCVDSVVFGAQDAAQLSGVVGAYDKVTTMSDGGEIDWLRYACADEDTVKPSRWNVLKKAG